MASIPHGLDRALVTHRFRVNGRHFISVLDPRTQSEISCSLDHMQNCKGWMVGVAFADVEDAITVYFNWQTRSCRISRMSEV